MNIFHLHRQLTMCGSKVENCITSALPHGFMKPACTFRNKHFSWRAVSSSTNDGWIMACWFCEIGHVKTPYEFLLRQKLLLSLKQSQTRGSRELSCHWQSTGTAERLNSKVFICRENVFYCDMSGGCRNSAFGHEKANELSKRPYVASRNRQVRKL